MHVGCLMIRKLFGLCVIVAALSGVAANAADFASLEWGEFKLDAESAVKPKSISVVNGDKQLSLTMALDGLVAHADGGKTENASSFSGEFIIQQPHYITLPAVDIEIKGFIVKTAGSTATLDITVGNIKQQIAWKADEVVSGPFTRTFTAPVAAGQLPAPFPVAATAIVNNNGNSGAILVSLESIDVKIGRVRLASNGF